MKVLSFYELLAATFDAHKGFNSIDELLDYAGPIYKVKKYDPIDFEMLVQDDIDLGKEQGFIFEANLLEENPDLENDVYTLKKENDTYRFECILFGEI